MKQFDEKTEFDETLKTMDSISMNGTDRHEVYSKLTDSMQQKKRKSSVINWSHPILSAIFVLLFLIGGGTFIVNQLMVEQAAPQEKHSDTIKAALKQSFSGPDNELKEILDQKESYLEEDKFQQYQDELLTYYDEVYQPYFKKNKIQEYVMENTLTFPEMAYVKGYRLKASSINVTEDKNNEGAFDFTVDVQTVKGGGKVDEVKVSGRVHIGDDGKIQSLRYPESGGLSALVQSIQSER
ncbi:hypothetical protein I7V34_21710 [Bacillus sp. V3]|nr:hypothetical protein I7V34_21710 [Bacillus sp. V3]